VIQNKIANPVLAGSDTTRWYRPGRVAGKWALTAAFALVSCARGTLGLNATMPSTQAQAAGEALSPSGTITLITGDRVTVTSTGGVPTVSVAPGPGREKISFVTEQQHQDFIVIPDDVAGLVASGGLDRLLFNVTKLLADGYGDDQRDDIPLIVTGVRQSTALNLRGTTDGHSGLRLRRTLPSLQALAVSQDKSSPGAILASVFGATTDLKASRTAAGRKIWLDRRYKLVLDQSVPQIGAPAAWHAGYTGAGIAVAVLDTGIDASHPDLAGKVVEAQNFCDGWMDATDDVGHGTHVASIIAGTGAASDGLYRGVAPDAQLLSAKVCDIFGCYASAILDGISWAVVTEQARVVNMSLGEEDTPEIDPVEQAINDLSTEYGTLFVVAAGNMPETTVIASPGSADSAFTVGAVDRDESLAPFSCRGPRVGDWGLKPDITAPGVGIVAAKASDAAIGEPVGESYLRLSGTSMATPHVAGAAAIMLQEHPDWTGAEVKAALMGAAHPNASLSAYEQGAGRVDVARAIEQSVIADPPSLSLGLAIWPHGDDPVLTRTVTYRNHGTTPIRLALSASMTGPDGRSANGMVHLDQTAIEVAPGAMVEVLVSVDTSGDFPDGSFTGSVVASDASDRVITPVAVVREPESYNLTWTVIDGSGNPSKQPVWLIPLRSDGNVDEIDLDGDGQATRRLVRSSYALWTNVGFNPSYVLTYPQLDLDRDTAVTLDARLARPTAITIPGVILNSHPRWSHIEQWHRSPGVTIGIDTEEPNELWTAHFGPDAPAGAFRAVAMGSWFRNATPTDVDKSDVYMLGTTRDRRFFDGWKETIDAWRLAEVQAHYAVSADGKLYGVAVPGVFRFDDSMYAASAERWNLYTGPFHRTEHYFGEGMQWLPILAQYDGVPFSPSSDQEARFFSELQSYSPGSVGLARWNKAPFAPVFRDGMATREVNPNDASGDDFLYVGPYMFGDQYARFGTSKVSSARRTVYRDGQKIYQTLYRSSALRLGIAVPPEPATYRFEVEVTRASTVSELSTHILSAWTFTSQKITGSDPVSLPVFALRFAPQLDEHNRTPSAEPLWVPVFVERLPQLPAADIQQVTLEASFDDGATWSGVPLMFHGDRWNAIITAPSDASYVSLRGVATDAGGNRVEETIIHAYGLAP
jgi:subtilisin family serine protease